MNGEGDSQDKQDKIVEGELLDKQPQGEGSDAPGDKAKTYFHPMAGALILGVDWVCFGMEAFSGFAAEPLVSVLAFTATFYGVLAIQRRLHGDGPKASLVKALCGAVAAGLPFPITGTVMGSAIIALSGLPTLPWNKK